MALFPHVRLASLLLPLLAAVASGCATQPPLDPCFRNDAQCAFVFAGVPDEVRLEPGEWAVVSLAEVDGTKWDNWQSAFFQPGDHTVVGTVRWSNGHQERLEIPLAAQASRIYRLLAVEAKPDDVAHLKVHERSGILQGLFASGALSAGIILSPILIPGTVVAAAVTGAPPDPPPPADRPADRRCFVWLEEFPEHDMDGLPTTGRVIWGERPAALSPAPLSPPSPQ